MSIRMQTFQVAHTIPQLDSDFKHAAYHGDIETIRTLLGNPRVDPTTEDNYAIRWASLRGHIEVVRLLLGDPRVCVKETLDDVDTDKQPYYKLFF